MFASGRVRINQNEVPILKVIKGETSRINQFQDDMVNCGTLRGFKHFMTQVRSRDELLIKLFKDSFNSQSTSESEPNSPDANSSFSSTNKNLPDASIRKHVNSYPTLRSSSIKSASKGTLAKLEKSVIGNGSRTSKYTSWSGLPISEAQICNDASKSTFLLGAYMKRKVPMVWLLADQHNLSANPGAVIKKPFDLDEEDPLILESLSNWYKDEILFLDVLLEILCTSLSSTTSLVNPFEINFEYFQLLPNEESIILIPALISFLTELLTKVPFLEKVLSDIEELHLTHLTCLENLSGASGTKLVKNPLSS